MLHRATNAAHRLDGVVIEEVSQASQQPGRLERPRGAVPHARVPRAGEVVQRVALLGGAGAPLAPEAIGVKDLLPHLVVPARTGMPCLITIQHDPGPGWHAIQLRLHPALHRAADAMGGTSGAHFFATVSWVVGMSSK